MSSPRRFISVSIAAVMLVSARAFAADEDPGEALARELKKIVNVYAIAESESADAVEADTAFYQGAIPAMLRTLDPHSVFFDPEQFAQLQRMERSESKGFGTIVNVLPGRVIVLQAIKGSPAAKAGLAAGDEILAINNIPLAQLEFDQLVALLSQARQQAAKLHIRHPGENKVVEYDVTPALVDMPSVDRTFLLQPRVGYIRISGFDAQTGKQTRQAIEKLGGEYLRGLILDLRDNPGGDVAAALETAALFLSPDQVVFSIAGRNKLREETRVPKLAAPYTFPVAVLMNEKSASASEIVAGALQDHDRASIVGERSFGKGLVQQVYPLSSNSGLALTTAFYYTPSGRSIQKQLHGGQLDQATSVAQGPFKTDSGRLVRGGGGIEPDELVPPANLSRLQQVTDATGLITTFAGEYLQKNKLGEDAEVTGPMLDELKLFLSEHNIQPGLSEWLSHRDWFSSRLKQELLNLTAGVAKGDEIQTQRDVVVKAALKRIGVTP